MSSVLTLDFETRSAADLKKVGLHNYANDPTTDVWCCAYCFDDEPVGLVVPKSCGGWHSDEVTRLVCHLGRGGTVIAHNAPFELAIWNSIMVPRYGWPVLKPEQCVCTMAMSLAMSLPASLENAAAAVGLDVAKDMAGHRLMLQMARPREVRADGTVVWWDDTEKLEKLYAYCKQDVKVERKLYDRLLKLSPSEQRIWQLDYRINNRGIYVDVPAVEAAIKVVEHEKARLNAEMRKITGNAVATYNAHSQLTDWLRYRGVEVAGVAKADIKALLDDDADIDQPDLPDDVRRALNIRREAAKSSTAKLTAMLEAVSADGRVRNTKQYHAATTGRWGGRRIQPDNLPRPKLKQAQIEEVFAMLAGEKDVAGLCRFIDMRYGAPMEVMSDCLRGMITAAPGNELIAMDFANIEGRVLAWLAGEEWKMRAFKDFDNGKGPDLYLVSAGRIFGCEPHEAKAHRQIGKVAELALGYQGGIGAFQAMARGYGVSVSDSRADAIKTAWRAAHPKIEKYWYDVEGNALAAVARPGTVTTAGAPGREVKFKVNGSFLWCKLPSGRNLCYPYPRIVEIETPWGARKDAVTFKAHLDSQARKKAKIVEDPSNGGNWYRIATYGGSLVENITQAVARDCLAEALIRLDAAGYPITMHVHDEAVVEAPAGSKDAMENVEHLMKQPPAWAAGLPIAVEGWRGTRYRK